MKTRSYSKPNISVSSNASSALLFPLKRDLSKRTLCKHLNECEHLFIPQDTPEFKLPPPTKSYTAFHDIFNHESLRILQQNKRDLPNYNKYEGRLKFPILDMIVIEAGNILYWLFEEKVSGYVLKRNLKKLSKDHIILYYQRQLIQFAKEVLKIKLIQKEEKIIDDINRLAILQNQKFNNYITDDLRYLDIFVDLKYIFIKYAPENEVLLNITELMKFIGDEGKFSSLFFIQNQLPLKTELQPIYCQVSKKDSFSPLKFTVFAKKPFVNNQSLNGFRVKKNNKTNSNTNNINANQGSKEVQDYKDEEEPEEPDSDIVKLNDNNMKQSIESLAMKFIKYYEQKEKAVIYNFIMKFNKTFDGNYKFVSGEKLICIKDPLAKLPNEPLQKMKASLPSDLRSKPYVKFTPDAFCFGDFCNFKVPDSFKSLRKNNKLEEEWLNVKKIPRGNMFSARDKNNDLPNSIPVIMIKRAYDNKNLVDIVLKAYNIFPPNVYKDGLLIMGNEATKLYVPKKDKFTHINNDFLYSKKSVCNNCYFVYKLVNGFFSNINEANSSSKAKELLMHGDKLRNPFEDYNQDNDDDIEKKVIQENLLFPVEKKELNLMKILMDRIRKKEMEAEKKKPKINKDDYRKPKSVHERDFQIGVNPRILKYNLLGKKSNNNFFDLIYNQVGHVSNNNLYNKLDLKKADEDFGKTMTNLRLHMGITSNSYDVTKKLSKNNGMKMRKKNDININNLYNEIDIFSGFKSMRRKVNKNILSIFDIKDIIMEQYNFEDDSQKKNNPPVIEKKKEDIDTMDFKVFYGMNQEKEKFDKKDENSPEINNLNVEGGAGPGKDVLTEIFELDKEKASSKHATNNDYKESNGEKKHNENKEKCDIEEKDADDLLKKLQEKDKETRDIEEKDVADLLKKLQEKDKETLSLEPNSSNENPIKVQPKIKDRKGSKSQTGNRRFSGSGKQELIRFETKDKKESLIDPFANHNDNDTSRKSIEKHELNENIISQDKNSPINNSKNNNINNTSQNLREVNETQLSSNSKIALQPRQSITEFHKILTKSIPKHNVRPNSSRNLFPFKYNNPFALDYYDETHQRKDKNQGINGIKKINKKASIIHSNTVRFTSHQARAVPTEVIEYTKKKQTNTKFIHLNKVIVSSVFYYDYKDNSKLSIPYYFSSTPMTIFGDNNSIVRENILLKCNNEMSIEEFGKFLKFEVTEELSNCHVFVYDQYTGFPYKIYDLCKNTIIKPHKAENKISNKLSSLIAHTYKDKSNKNIMPHDFSKIVKKDKIMFVILNDFFDGFTKYEDKVISDLKGFSSILDEFKIVFFNLPGQDYTTFAKKRILNNIFYSDVLDRFLFRLYNNKIFDDSYSIILLGFGNGGQIALSFTSFYEKHWDFLNSIVLFNSFAENDDYINKSMVEIIKVAENTKVAKLVEFFIKSITLDPNKLFSHEVTMNYEFENARNLQDDAENNLSLFRYYSVAQGYFYNVQISHKDIKTPILLVHSNQNCFITINNINPIFYFLPKSSLAATTKSKPPTAEGGLKSQIDYTKYNFDDLDTNEVHRKLIVVEGPHDIFDFNANEVNSIILGFLRYLFKNKIFIKAIEDDD